VSIQLKFKCSKIIYNVISVSHFDKKTVFWFIYSILEILFLKFIVNVNILLIFDFKSAKISILLIFIHLAEV